MDCDAKNKLPQGGTARGGESPLVNIDEQAHVSGGAARNLVASAASNSTNNASNILRTKSSRALSQETESEDDFKSIDSDQQAKMPAPKAPRAYKAKSKNKDQKKDTELNAASLERLRQVNFKDISSVCDFIRLIAHSQEQQMEFPQGLRTSEKHQLKQDILTLKYLADHIEIDKNTNEETPSVNERSIDGAIKDLHKEIKEIKKIITPQLPPRYERPMSYAKVVREGPTNENTNLNRVKPAIIVSSKRDVCSKETIMKDFRGSINFRESKYAPSKVKNISNNRIRVEFDTITQRDDALKKLESSPELSVQPARLRKPLFIIKGIDNDTKRENIISTILQQNDNIAQSSDNNPENLRLLFTRKVKNKDTYNAVLEATPVVWKAVTGVGSLYVDYVKAKVESYSPFKQCYKCLQFGHLSNQCTNKEICSYCSVEGHGFNNCPSKNNYNKIRCYNCEHNNNYGKNTNPRASYRAPNHSAVSMYCPTIQAVIKSLEASIDYGY